jgi:hypothetical protein
MRLLSTFVGVMFMGAFRSAEVSRLAYRRLGFFRSVTTDRTAWQRSATGKPCAQVLVSKATNLPLNISDLPIEILLRLSGAEEDLVNRKADVDLLNSRTPVNSVARVLDAHGWNLTRALESYERDALAAAMRRTQWAIFRRFLPIVPQSSEAVQLVAQPNR